MVHNEDCINLPMDIVDINPATELLESKTLRQSSLDRIISYDDVILFILCSIFFIYLSFICQLINHCLKPNYTLFKYANETLKHKQYILTELQFQKQRTNG